MRQLVSSRKERVAIKCVLWDLLGRKVLWELSSLSSLEGEGRGRGTQILPHGHLCRECTRHKATLDPTGLSNKALYCAVLQ